MDDFDKALQETGAAGAIMRLSPNGIALVDSDGEIRLVNDAFRKMFSTGDKALSGTPVKDVVRSDCFDRANDAGGALSTRGTVSELDVHYRAELFRVSDDGLVCGIFVDTSAEERARSQLKEMKSQMLSRAQEVINHQMRTAQEIAGLLGETTAETKVLLANLMDLFRKEDFE